MIASEMPCANLFCSAFKDFLEYFFFKPNSTIEYKSFVLENEGKNVISATDWELLIEMEATIHVNPISSNLVNFTDDYEVEKEIFFKCFIISSLDCD